MRKTAKTAPRNSIIFVMDDSIGEIPENEAWNGSIAATSSCVVISTLCEMDGETSITLSNEEPKTASNNFSAFDGILDTPSKIIGVYTVPTDAGADGLPALLEMPVPRKKTKVQVFVNERSEPDIVLIVVDPVRTESK